MNNVLKSMGMLAIAVAVSAATTFVVLRYGNTIAVSTSITNSTAPSAPAACGRSNALS